ncbi:MAG: hypothetical protein AB7K24_02865 [Gemmataceae bacterium]
MYINLMMAGFWVAIGVTMLIYHRLNPQAPLEILGTGISAGWLAIFLALYNVARWWSAASYVKEKEAAESRAERIQDRQKYSSLMVERPEFDFTKDEKKEDEETRNGN